MKNSIALKIFFKITHRWNLTSEQERILLSVPKSTFYRWKRQLKGSIKQDTLERISYILGIYKGLRILLSEKSANQWIMKPNSAPIFGGRPALDKLMQGRVIDLADVSRYVKSNL